MPSKKRPPSQPGPTAPKIKAPARSKKAAAASPKATRTSTPRKNPHYVAPLATLTTSGPALSDDRPLHVLMIASEAHPFAEAGGLAEVAGALPLALARLGHRVTLIMPRYRGLPVADSQQTVLSIGGRAQPVGFSRTRMGDNVEAVFVDAPELFDREALYGTAAGDFADNAWRFAVFSRAALEYPRLAGERPAVMHAHDWQTGLVAAYQKMHLTADPIVGRVPAVFTIHNLAFQGIFPPATLDEIGLGWDVFNLQAMEFWGQISYLKAGINFSERITTVSPTYAQRDPDARDGLRLRWRAQSPPRRSRRHPQRHRHRALESSGGFFRSRATSAPPIRAASGRRNELLLEAMQLPSDDAALARPVIGLVVSTDRSEGIRPDCRSG